MLHGDDPAAQFSDVEDVREEDPEVNIGLVEPATAEILTPKTSSSLIPLDKIYGGTQEFHGATFWNFKRAKRFIEDYSFNHNKTFIFDKGRSAYLRETLDFSRVGRVHAYRCSDENCQWRGLQSVLHRRNRGIETVIVRLTCEQSKHSEDCASHRTIKWGNLVNLPAFSTAIKENPLINASDLKRVVERETGHIMDDGNERATLQPIYRAKRHVLEQKRIDDKKIDPIPLQEKYGQTQLDGATFSTMEEAKNFAGDYLFNKDKSFRYDDKRSASNRITTIRCSDKMCLWTATLKYPSKKERETGSATMIKCQEGVHGIFCTSKREVRFAQMVSMPALVNAVKSDPYISIPKLKIAIEAATGITLNKGMKGEVRGQSEKAVGQTLNRAKKAIMDELGIKKGLKPLDSQADSSELAIVRAAEALQNSDGDMGERDANQLIPLQQKYGKSVVENATFPNMIIAKKFIADYVFNVDKSLAIDNNRTSGGRMTTYICTDNTCKWCLVLQISPKLNKGMDPGTVHVRYKHKGHAEHCTSRRAIKLAQLQSMPALINAIRNNHAIKNTALKAILENECKINLGEYPEKAVDLAVSRAKIAIKQEVIEGTIAENPVYELIPLRERYNTSVLEGSTFSSIDEAKRFVSEYSFNHDKSFVRDNNKSRGGRVLTLRCSDTSCPWTVVLQISARLNKGLEEGTVHVRWKHREHSVLCTSKRAMKSDLLAAIPEFRNTIRINQAITVNELKRVLEINCNMKFMGYAENLVANAIYRAKRDVGEDLGITKRKFTKIDDELSNEEHGVIETDEELEHKKQRLDVVESI